jgi:hypothetical protein
MKIIDTFLFSQPHEKDVLLCKLHAEYEYVDEIIGLESDYDFRGNYKGHCLDKVLEDTVFDPFRDKVKVITTTNNLLGDRDKNEKNYFQAEFASRALCWDYVNNKYSDEDWLIMSDVDEMLDFSNPKRRDILLEGFKDSGPEIQWQNLKFWWDFDNLNLNPDKYIPCHKIGALKERENPFHHRNNHCKRLEPELCVGLEYAYCFTPEGNWNKVTTFAHDKYQQETLERAYFYNTWHKESARGESINNAYDFFETIQLDETNSTEFVLKNLDRLKVKTIDTAYSVNRQYGLNIDPHPCRTLNLMRGFKINKKYDYLRIS